MARYKNTEKGQDLFLTVDLEKQIIPGTYEFTLKHLIENKLDLGISDYGTVAEGQFFPELLEKKVRNNLTPVILDM